jgi:hypothetical protein
MGADRNRRARAGQTVAVLVVLGTVMIGGAGASAAPSGTWSQAVDFPLPPNASTTGFIDKSPAVGCPASGTCVAVSAYEDSFGDGQAMAANESGGVWSEATQITTLPPNAATTGLFSSLESVSCPVSGSCTAVGWYTDSSAKEQMMAVAETGGAWNQASEIALPANQAANPDAHLVSLSCPAVGSCVAIGSYADSSEKLQMMAATESGGVWGGASQIPMPAAATSWELSSISCSAPQSCVAVGWYYDGASISRTMVITDTGGSWGQAAEVTSPANAATGASTRARLSSVSCPATGACVTVGNYTTTLGVVEAMTATETSGSWEPATAISPPANTFSAPEASFASVSCRSVGSCVTIGPYGQPSAYPSAMVATESAGSWGAASQITAPPPDPPTGEPASTLLSSVACPATESCVAVGLYHQENPFITRAMAVNEVSSSSGEKGEVSKGGGSPPPGGGSTTPSPGTTPPPAKAAAGGIAALASSTATVNGSNTATLKLTCTGSTPCSGKLTLTVNRASKKAKEATNTVTIGSGSFSILPGKSGIVRVKLNATGRALLNAAHGRLSATLTILTSSITPATTQTKSVRLVQQKQSKKISKNSR